MDGFYGRSKNVLRPGHVSGMFSASGARLRSSRSGGQDADGHAFSFVACITYNLRNVFFPVHRRFIGKVDMSGNNGGYGAVCGGG